MNQSGCISAYSQARAERQLRLTVASETSSTSATSVLVRPPKYLSSTTRARSGEMSPRRVSTSSSSSRSSSSDSAPRWMVCSVNSTPSRLSAFLRRASSMRIRRMVVVAMAMKWARSRQSICESPNMRIAHSFTSSVGCSTNRCRSPRRTLRATSCMLSYAASNRGLRAASSPARQACKSWVISLCSLMTTHGPFNRYPLSARSNINDIATLQWDCKHGLLIGGSL